MVSQYPRFESKVRDRVVNPAFQEVAQPGYGVVLKYSVRENTATVLMSQPGSDQIGHIYTNVPCPTTVGLQMAAPEFGRPCWVQFADGTMSNPMITHYFNHNYEDIDHRRHSQAINDTPRFMTEL